MRKRYLATEETHQEIRDALETIADNVTYLKGDKGDKGDKGETPVFEIGTVTSGSLASASITGTSVNPILNLTLPKGDKGDKGDTGAMKTFQIGTVTQGDTPTVTIASDENNVVTLNFVLP